jgi:hypothetical protein
LSWVHDWLFSDQDKRILERVVPGPEELSRSDMGVIGWRRFAADHARRRAREGAGVDGGALRQAEAAE